MKKDACLAMLLAGGEGRRFGAADRFNRETRRTLWRALSNY